MEKYESLLETLDDIDQRIAVLEEENLPEAPEELAPVLSKTSEIMADLLKAYAIDKGKPMPESEDLLELFKAFVKGDPSLNAARDNVRELVYYQNCLAMNREDALPKMPARTAVRTTRHVYLYLRSRCEQEERLD